MKCCFADPGSPSPGAAPDGARSRICAAASKMLQRARDDACGSTFCEWALESWLVARPNPLNACIQPAHTFCGRALKRKTPAHSGAGRALTHSALRMRRDIPAFAEMSGVRLYDSKSMHHAPSALYSTSAGTLEPSPPSLGLAGPSVPGINSNASVLLSSLSTSTLTTPPFFKRPKRISSAMGFLTCS